MKASGGNLITSEKALEVQSNIYAGGVADMSMAPRMRNDQWRAVVSWKKRGDLDTHAEVKGRRTYYARKWNRVNNLVTRLEVDDWAYGPETLFYSNIGKCSRGGSYNCDIHYKIYVYSGSNRGKIA